MPANMMSMSLFAIGIEFCDYVAGPAEAKMQRVAIVEPKHSHEEVILPQVELLRGHFDIHVVAPKSLLEEDLLRETSHLYTAWPYGHVPRGSRVRRLLGTPSIYFAISRVLADIKPDVIVFNSTYLLPEVALMAQLFRKYKKVQIIHNFQKYLPPSTRWLYRSFDANLVISEQVHRYVVQNHPRFADLDYFLPIFFDSFVARDPGRTRLPEEGRRQLVLGVFGTVERHRRNYQGLLEAASELPRRPDEPGLHLHIAGRAPSWVKDYISGHGLQDQVRHYDSRLSYAEMFYLLEHTDLVMFLIDNSVGYAGFYNKYKITGTSTLMKAFKKAGLSSTDFPVDASLADKCFYYQGANIGSVLSQVAAGAISPGQVRDKTALYEEESLFSFKYQQERLLSVLHRVIGSAP
jgi:glycosyltransferase involved in cell wall biosynthesis